MNIKLGMNLIGVSDLEKAKVWYQNIFGMELVEYKPPSFMEMRLGDNLFNIEIYSDEREDGFKEVPVGGLKSCVFQVEHMDEFMDNCKKYAVTIPIEPVLQSFGWWTAKIQDPDGNIFIIESEDIQN